MAWIFKPYTALTHVNNMLTPHIDFEIDDNIIKYFHSITQITISQVNIYNTGFVSKAFRVFDPSDYHIKFTFTMSNKTPRAIIENLRSFLRNTNGGGISVRFKDSFINGTSGTPITYLGRINNALDATDSNIIISVLTFSLFVWKVL